MRPDLRRTVFVPERSARPSWVLAVLALLVVCGLTSPNAARAYCRLTTETQLGGQCASSGLPLYWPRQCISYSVVPRPTDTGRELEAVRDAIDRSFRTWTNVRCERGPLGLRVAQTEALSDCTKPAYNGQSGNVNAIVFVPNWHEHDYPSNAFGLTLVWRENKTGKIVDVDMLLNESLGEIGICKDECPAKMVDLENVVTHEAGHFFGLGHSEYEDAAMYGRSDVGEIEKRYLSDDDREGICAIYGELEAPSCTSDDFIPNNGFEPKCSAGGKSGGCGVVSLGQQPVASASFVGMIGVALGLLLSRRRRR